MPPTRFISSIARGAVVGLLAVAAYQTPAHGQTVSVGSATATETNGDGLTMSFPITVEQMTTDVRLVLATRPETALADQDFIPRTAVFGIQNFGGVNRSFSFVVPGTDEPNFTVPDCDVDI